MYKYLTIVILISNLLFPFIGISQTWSSLGTGVNNNVYSFAVDTINNELYIGGSFSIAGGYPATGIAKWDGTTWKTVGEGISGEVRSLLFFNGELYAAGWFDTAGNVLAKNIAKWNGSNWDSLGAGLNGRALTMAEYNGQLYAGGYFDSSGITQVNHISKWDGNNWVDVNGGTNNRVLTLCVFNNEMFVGGRFTMAGGLNARFVAKWNGFDWDSVGVGFNKVVRKLYVYNYELYAGGDFTPKPTNNSYIISKWNGTSWQAFSSPSGGNDPAVRDMINYNGDLYIVGEFTFPSYIGQFNGNSYSNLSTGLSWVGGSLAVFENELYVGGYFGNAGGQPYTSDLARWNVTVGISESIKDNQVRIFPTPFREEISISILKCHLCDLPYELLLYDDLGKLVKHIQGIESNMVKINMGDMPIGIYLFELRDNGNMVVKRGKLIAN